MSLCPTSSSTSSTTAGRLPTKADKEQKKEEIAIKLIEALGKVLITYGFIAHDQSSLDQRKKYCLYPFKHFLNNTVLDCFLAFDLDEINSAAKSANEVLAEMDKSVIDSAKSFSTRLERILTDKKYKTDKYMEFIGLGLCGIPALLEAEKVKKISESPICLVSIVHILGKQMKQSPEFFKTEASCLLL